MTTIFYVLSLLGTLALTFATFARRSDRSASYFGLTSLFLVLWLSMQFLAINLPDFTDRFVTLSLLVFSFVPIFALLFTIEFVGLEAGKRDIAKKVLPIFLVTMIILSILPGTILNTEVKGHTLVIEGGVGYVFQSIMAASLVLISVGIFITSYRKFDSLKRAAANYLMIGFFIAVVGNLVSGLIFANNQSVQFAGPLSILVMTALVSYAISRHKLFDIRLVVARSLAYILLLGATSLIFAVVIVQLPAIVIGSSQKLELGQQAYYTISAIFLAFAFSPLKNFFDKVTNKLFYQDAYEPQVFLDELNRVLVSTIDLNNLLKLSAEVIEQNIKAEFCVFGLKETDFAKQRIIGNAQRKFDYQDISYARVTTPQMDHKVIVADHLDEPDKELRGKMRKNDVAVLTRLTSDVDQEGVGYIVLGAKKSGNPYNSQDIRVLETIANAMVIAIDNALRFEEIQKFNITLEKRVEDATRRLQRANDKLIALDQTKDDFISMASHQLRTPLTSVKGYLSMVLEGDAGKVNPKQAKLLDQAFISSQRMVYLIADLLNVSRLRTGKFVIDSSPVDLAEIVEGEVSQLQETAEARQLKLKYERPKNFPQLMLDETKIRQVVMNFIDNAIYYTPAGGEIVVRLKQTGDTVEYTVQDTGIGVPRGEQHNLFSKFFRAGNARKARPDGTGLGLFMAKKVIVAQGGAVVFRSAEGKGSTFGFTFSKAKLAPEGEE